ncbi:unnamed protein product, partial [Hapterophycus canaliculatus]
AGAAVDSAVDGAEPDSGLDWLAVAKSGGQKKSKPQATAALAKGAAAPAAPGGWLSSGKLGISTEEEDEDVVGTANGGADSGAAAFGAGKSKKRKQARGSVSAGGWLASGGLGVESEEESGDDSGAVDVKFTARGVGITIETQTEDDIEAFTGKGATEKNGASKLPPWAKPYVPPPKVEAVPDTPPEAEETQGTENQEPEVPDWLAAAAGTSSEKVRRGSATLPRKRGVTTGKGKGDADGGGLSWLVSVAGEPGTGASAPAASSPATDGVAADGGGPEDWLSVAKASDQNKRKQDVTATAAKASAAPAATGGWLSSGNLGISTKYGSDSDDDEITDRGAAAATKSKKRKQAKGSASTATGPAGWLASGALGAPAEDESDGDEEGSSRRSKPILVTIETQTDGDIEAIVERGDVPKLPPWAKPYVPPPKPKDVPNVAAEATKGDGPTDIAPATPDWILASVGGTSPGTHGGLDRDASTPDNWLVQAAQPGSSGEAAAAAGTLGDAGNGGLDWLRQAAVADTKPNAAKHSQSATAFQQRSGGGDGVGRKAAAAQSPLAWMSAMKRRSSMDLNDPSVETASDPTKANAVPGGWLQKGAVGAPDAVEEENALEAARAASLLTSETNPGRASRRSSFSGGPPPWAPEKDKSVVEDTSSVNTTASGVARRPSLSGGMPKWAPAPAAVAGAKSAENDHESREYKDDSQSAAEEEGKPEVPGVGVNDWLAAAAGITPVEKTSDAVDGESDPVIAENAGDGGGLDWLTQVAGKDTASAINNAAPSTAGMDAGKADVGVDWLAAARSSKPNNKTAAVNRASITEAAPSGWMSSGKLGLSAGNDSDEDRTDSTKAKKQKETRGSVRAAGMPGGWLSSGALGAPAEDSGGEDGADGGNAERAVMVTTGTQTEDDIESATKAENGPKLPPWAKPWVPPLQAPTPV